MANLKLKLSILRAVELVKNNVMGGGRGRRLRVSAFGNNIDNARFSNEVASVTLIRLAAGS